mmetsp:Transcript_23810/g.28733  ORF Transcript_23810/g.28733 Transcript_23810/m.28733 type:complete len:198 (-) Transcript_23810:729-1322(-)|eukprot:CAMPEP_0197848052 /NCGR_PEP_ID=MMETSP1438-20131217/7897_1 /TAXON_ID=1461541 /ORGANISM="Pterosperma sp., Strain CCMP1384" /LENGTH=197 /DNA_ID=CAMNT_0043460179 /DNA_START=249 /DNA_END=842 /DNA_ORIENTATION=+
MPSAGKIESYTVHCESGGDHHETKATQPRWLLRKKTYKPLPPGLPDYAIGKDWLPRIPNAPLGPDPVLPSVRTKQSHTGVMETFKGIKNLEAKKATVEVPPRSYTAPATILRADLPAKSVYKYGRPLMKMTDIPPLENPTVVKSATPKVDLEKAQMSGQASTARKISDISRYFEDLGHARVGQLLRDRQGGLECIRT